MTTFEDSALLITAWRRPYYLQEALASWSKVPEVAGLRKVTIALGFSDRQEEQFAVIAEAETLLGRQIHVRRDSSRATFSPGMHRALGEAAAAEFAEDPGLKYLVLSEEDVVVSDDVLRYHAWAREQWEDDPRVLVVTSHNPLGTWHLRDKTEEGVSQENVQLYPFFNPWCWGTWRTRWDAVLYPGWDWDATKGENGWDSGYDWQIGRLMREQGLLSPNPDASRSKNIGMQEGVYTRAETLEAVGQAIGFREHRDNPGYQLVEPDMRFTLLNRGHAGALGPRCPACGSAELKPVEQDHAGLELLACPDCGWSEIKVPDARCPRCGSKKLAKETTATGEEFPCCTECTWSEA